MHQYADIDQRPVALRTAVRMVCTLVANSLAVLLADRWLDGFDVSGRSWLLAAALIGSIGAIATPLVVRYAFPVIIYTFGLASIALNVMVVELTAEIMPGVAVDSIGDALLVAIMVALTSMIVGWVFAVDDDATVTKLMVRRAIRRSTGRIEQTDEPGVIFLEIDGCSHGVLQRAMRSGWMPNLASWLRHDYRLVRWHADLSSQTSASQSGLLQGSNDGIVAFRWWERDRDAVVVSSKPRDAMLIEERHHTGHGLLANGGASRNNLVSGDASVSALTLSRLRAKGGASRVWGTYFASPDNVLRTILLVIGDVVRELAWTVRFHRRDVTPRLRKGWKYPFMRSAMTVVMRDITTEMVVGDIVAGAPAVYATFVGYDEVAHHDGVERPSALEQLRLLDRSFARIAAARRHAPRPYHVVVLSDHGQSQGATFLQRYGITLEQLVRRHTRGVAIAGYTEDVESIGQFTGNLGGDRGHVDAMGSTVDPTHESHEADVIVMASGCLGLVYLRAGASRHTREQIELLHPDLIGALAGHSGIGFVLVAGRGGDGFVIGAEGEVRLSDGAVRGSNPLADYPPHVLDQLRRHHSFEHTPDLLVMARWDAATDDVPAFEELIGSHGGIGGEQTEPFVLFPRSLDWPEGDELIGCAAVHDVIRSWTPAARGQTHH
jgi:uncharacterized membrane protein YvlD (DUF360 family)